MSSEAEDIGTIESIKMYLTDPTRIKTTHGLNDCVDYMNNRVTTTTILGAFVGAGSGYTTGGLTSTFAANAGFKGGVFGTLFFGVAYGTSWIRRRDDAVNYSVSGAINYGIYRTLRFGPRGAMTGIVMGATCGMLYKICAEEMYYGLRNLWISKRRTFFTESPQVKRERPKINPFPPELPCGECGHTQLGAYRGKHEKTCSMYGK